MTLEADRDLSKLESTTRAKVEKALAEATWVFVTEGFRSDERHFNLYAQGRTRPGQIVTWVDGVNVKSKHQLGRAVDIAFKGSDLYPADHAKWVEVANIFKKHGMIWGYDEWGIDKPHFHCDLKPLYPAYIESGEKEERTPTEVELSNSRSWQQFNRIKELAQEMERTALTEMEKLNQENERLRA